MNRRNFMTSMTGLGALCALPGLGSLRANAAPRSGPPRRLVIWYQPNGYGEDPAAVHARSLENMSVMSNKLTYLRGLWLPTQDAGHEGPMQSMLRGGHEGASIDQVLAGHIGSENLHPSLLLGIRSDTDTFGSYCSFRDNGDATSLIRNPRDTWAAVFAGLDIGDDPEQQAALQALWAQRDAIMTHNQDAADAMLSGLATSQRERVQQYISSIGEIRNDLLDPGEAPDVCSIPVEPGPTPDNAWNEFTNYEFIADGQMTMMAHALACDVTRVGLIQFNRSTSQVYFDDVIDGHSFVDQHHALTHLPGNGQAESDLQLVHDWYDQKFLQFIQALDGMMDVDGSTVLDNTVVVRVTECMISNGHTFNEGHHLIAGGGNFIQSGNHSLVVSNSDPMGRLWLTLSHALGVELSSAAGYSGNIINELMV